MVKLTKVLLTHHYYQALMEINFHFLLLSDKLSQSKVSH